MHPTTVFYAGSAWAVLFANSARYLITRHGETKWIDQEDAS